MRLGAVVFGNGAGDFVGGNRWHREVGCRRFGGEPRELLGEEGLHGGGAHRLDAVPEGFGAAGFHRALHRPGSGRPAVRSLDAGEEFRGAGLRRGAGHPGMVPVEASVEGGLDRGGRTARIVGLDAEGAADPVRHGPGQEAREEAGVVLQRIDAVMAPAACDPDRGADAHR